MLILKDTTEILRLLRIYLGINNLFAYLVPTADEHFTEFVAECHQRRAFLSGFTGSAGTAMVTANDALLWTDGRYHFQAEKELDDNWTLMKEGLAGVNTTVQWLIREAPTNARIGVDPTLYTKAQWDAMSAELTAKGLLFVDITTNLVDEVWGAEKPNCSANPIFNLEHRFSGKNSSVKINDVRAEMVANEASILVVTELDEVAWLLNLRGRDIPSSSTFFGFVILTATSVDFFVNPEQVSADVESTLKQNIPSLIIREYQTAYSQLPIIANQITTGSVWLGCNANYALTKTIEPQSRLLIKLTPISLMKALKNEIEVEGYRKALVRDAAALCEFFAWLESEIEDGNTVTEISAADHLYNIRKERGGVLFLDKSFTTISATGVNGAIIHYMPTVESNTALSKNEVYLLDSGGLYFDGTTDITRTMHFGRPTDFEKEAYTRVLKGHIALARAHFPSKTAGHRLDSFARAALWAVGLEYLHGTGHGIGSFLNVHEGPSSIGASYSVNDPGLQENMFTSNEPGYYDEERKFGIRLENIVRVTSVDLPNNFQQRGFLGFEDLTFVPYQHKMIEFSLLTDEEIDYLNKYQVKARELIGGHISQNNFPPAATEWLIKETVPIGRDGDVGGAILTCAPWAPALLIIQVTGLFFCVL